MNITPTYIQMMMNRQMYSRAYSLYIHGNVGTILTKDAGKTTIIRGTVTDRGNHEVRAQIDHKQLYVSTECNCIDDRLYGTCCHAGALLLKYSLKGANIDTTELMTSSDAQKLLEAYQPHLPAAVEKVTLQPLLNLESTVPALAFKIGCAGGSYIIKDLADFTSRLKNRQSFEYGTKLTFDHNPDAFDDDSMFWCDFICGRAPALETAIKQTSRINSSRIDLREIPLNGHDFDMMFEHMLPSKRIANRGAGGRYLLFDSDPKVTLSMKREGRQFRLTVSPTPRIINGASDCYALIDTEIYRLSPDFAHSMVKMLTAVSEAESPLMFNEKGAREFCMNVLPEVGKYTTGSDLAVLDDIRPEELEVSYLIDMPERGRLTGSVSFHYGEKFVPSDATDDDFPDIRRNTNQEKSAITALLEFFDPPEEGSTLYQITDEERIYDFLKTGTEKLAQSGQVFVTDRLKNMNMTRPIRPSVSLKIDSGLLNFGVDTGEFPREELALLMKSVREKRKYYRLRDGRFMGLENGEMKSFTDTADALGLKDSDLAKGGALMPMYRAMYLDTAFREDKDIQAVDRNAEFKRLVRDFKTVEDSDFELPENLEKVMRPYQKNGFRWLRTLDAYHFGGILADDMGLGKTLQVLSFLQSLKNEGKLDRASLIVCPASLVLNWGDEAEKWTPDLRTCLLTAGDARRNRLNELVNEYDLIVTSYDLLRRDIDSHEKNRYYACILDEAQYIKNQETQSAKAVRRINAVTRFALTGTPVENRLSELWSIFEFLMPGYLNQYSKFRDRYEKPITTDEDKAARVALGKIVHPFILRRMKTDVLTELPPKTEMNCYIEMEETQRKYYLAYVEKIKEVLETADSSDRMKILAMLTRLRQLCCDPALWVDRYEGGSAKLDECIRMCEELVSGGHRILIFSQFTSMLSRIEKRLDESGIDNFTLKGDTPLTERANLVRRYNAGEVPVFLISLKAGGTGLNLTGADTVIHYDPWWNVSAQNQATDRCYRIGQDKSVTVYKLIAKDSIEENIIRLQDKKLSLARVVTDNTDDNIMNMSSEEIIELLNTK